MANVQHGTIVGLRKFRALYEGSDELYAGSVLCFNYDTTDNYLGVNKATGLEGTTTADGYQNEGKFMRLEKPATDNLKFIAGLTAKDGRSGTEGPMHVDLYDLNDSGVVAVRSASDVTAGDAMFASAGAYTVDTVGEVFLGYAMETVDRASTNGLVLMYANRSVAASNLTAGADSPSPLIWNEIDLDLLRNDFSAGFLYENDYMDEIDITTTDGYVVANVTTGTIHGSVAVQGGVFTADSAGHTGADDGVNVQLTNCLVKPAAGVKIAFEARVKVIDAGDDQYFIGLAGVDTTLIAAGILDDAVDKCGFHRIAASTADKISSVTARTSAEDSTADVADLADATWVTLGFVIDGLTSVKFYVNGVLVETGTTVANIPNAVMCLSYVAQVEQTSADAELDVDWVRVAQVGGRS